MPEAAAERAPQHRLVTNNNAGAVAAFLAPDAACSLTGSVTRVDAGHHVAG
jgi:enoyl-[acyl-carrier protein] reductase I